MNDRFKFRFWDKETQTMQKIPMVELKHRITLDKIFADDRVIFMQCIGLKDKNDKLIYEGDIVRFKDCNDILVINYQKEMACFAPQFYCNGGYGGRLWFDDYDSVECQFYKSNNFEVIGNIYENKSLLE